VATIRITRTPLLALFLAGGVLAANAFAQEPAAEYPAPCDASKMTKADVERAHTVFLSGKQFLEESNYDKAISYFKDAYAIDCSIHAILPIIATAYERKGDKPATIRALQEYERRAPNAPDHDVIERRIKNLTDQLAHEQAPPPAAPSATPSALPSSAASSTAWAGQPPPPAKSTPPFIAAPAAAAGSTEIVRPSHSNPGPWIVIGLGAAAVVGSVVLYAIGIPDVTTAARTCPDRKGCPADVANEGNQGRSLEATGGLVGGVGLVAIGTGILWYFLSHRNTDPPSVPTVSLAPGYVGVTVANTF
jgi:hypothetical protein